MLDQMIRKLNDLPNKMKILCRFCFSLQAHKQKVWLNADKRNEMDELNAIIQLVKDPPPIQLVEFSFAHFSNPHIAHYSSFKNILIYRLVYGDLQ